MNNENRLLQRLLNRLYNHWGKRDPVINRKLLKYNSDNLVDMHRLEPIQHEKKWGGETWICNNEKFCGKILTFKKGTEFSTHFHDEKEEVFYLLSGEIEVTLINTDDSSKHNARIKAGEVIEIPRLVPHRIKAIKASKVIEFSTHHEESDSYRIEAGDSQK